MNPKHITQESNTCAVACIAMVLGITHDEAMDLCGPAFEGGGRVGLSMAVVVDILCKQGYACYPKNFWDYEEHTARPEWPPQPFAPIHVVVGVVLDYGKPDEHGRPTEVNHAVILTSDGRVLDPARTQQKTSLLEFVRVIEVIGFWSLKKWWQFW